MSEYEFTEVAEEEIEPITPAPTIKKPKLSTPAPAPVDFTEAPRPVAVPAKQAVQAMQVKPTLKAALTGTVASALYAAVAAAALIVLGMVVLQPRHSAPASAPAVVTGAAVPVPVMAQAVAQVVEPASAVAASAVVAAVPVPAPAVAVPVITAPPPPLVVVAKPRLKPMDASTREGLDLLR